LFGKPQQQPPAAAQNFPQPGRIAASEAAKIQGGGLVQIIITNPNIPEFYVFLNEQYAPQLEIEGFSLQIEVGDTSGVPIVRATLAQIVTNVAGQRLTQRRELFPGTLEIVTLGRRVSVTCTSLNSLDGLWISLGLLPDGTGRDITGAKSLNILMEGGLFSARLIWMDGAEEELFQ
jgi:hypothetical protein